MYCVAMTDPHGARILASELDGADGLIVTFSDGTTAGYLVEELPELRPHRERAPALTGNVQRPRLSSPKMHCGAVGHLTMNDYRHPLQLAHFYAPWPPRPTCSTACICSDRASNLMYPDG